MAERKIKDLMKDMEQATLIIPSFQRNYVWSREQIEALFDSFMRELPISSLLLWKLDSETINKIAFKFYKFNAIYKSEHNNQRANPQNGIYYAAIDGQQRLTSLFIGFFGSYSERKKYSRKSPNLVSYVEYKLYLRLTPDEMETVSPESNKYNFKFLSDNDIKRMTGIDDLNNLPHPIFKDNEGKKWLKVSDIPKHSDKSYKSKLRTEFILNDDEDEVLCELHNIYHSTGKIECIEWDGKPEEAISVFVRYNSKGTVLTPGQVIMAIMTEDWPDVRNDFKELQSKVDKLGFDKARVEYIVKALLTVYTGSPKNNIQAITNDTVLKFKQEWETFSSTVIKMFSFLNKQGFNRRTLTSYNATLPILYYLLHKEKQYKLDNDERNISKWLIGVLLLGAFSGQSDNAISKAIKPIQEKLKAGETLDHFPADEISESLKTSIRDVDVADFLNIQKEDTNAALLMSILVPEKWDIASELDHIHPISKFDKNDKEYEIANSIVNLQPLDGGINVSKGKTEFIKWMGRQFNSAEDREKYLEEIGIASDTSQNFDDRKIMWDKRRAELEQRLHKFFKK